MNSLINIFDVGSQFLFFGLIIIIAFNDFHLNKYIFSHEFYQKDELSFLTLNSEFSLI